MRLALTRTKKMTCRKASTGGVYNAGIDVSTSQYTHLSIEYILFMKHSKWLPFFWGYSK